MSGMLKFFAELTITVLWLGSGAGQILGQPPGAPPEPRPPLRGGPLGRWWDNPEMAKKLDMTADQIRKMDEVFQASRIRLIDLHGALRKEEAMLEPLMQADSPDDSKILPQIDRVAAARAELEKANARLLLGIRHVLTVDQWKKLQSEDMRPPVQDGQPRPRRQEED
jgi:Spy/CpxP family protein refolding chaperone